MGIGSQRSAICPNRAQFIRWRWLRRRKARSQILSHLEPERSEALGVARDRVVVEVSLYHPTEPSPELWDRQVTPARQSLFDLLQLGAEPLGHCLPLDDEPSAFPFSPTDMGESQEVEGFWLAASSPLVAFDCEPAELNQPGLVGMQCQSELFHAGRKLAKEPLGIVAVLETHDEVVRVPDDDDIARACRFRHC